MSRKSPWIACAALVAVLSSSALPTRADDDEGEEAKSFAVSHPTYQAECGGCHVAFPPELLPAASWRALMAGLDKHFGTDASLDDPTRRELTSFFEANAGRVRAIGADGKPLLRITETNWFRREHRPGREGIASGTFASEPVKSAANCGACHRDAAAGNYAESGIRIPRQAQR